MTSTKAQRQDAPAERRVKYRPPNSPQTVGLNELLEFCGRPVDDAKADLFRKDGEAEPVIYWAGDLELLKKPSVSVIGARDVSDEGMRRAGKISRELATAGIVVTSGLAKGVDGAAHRGALAVGGDTVAVIGTPLNKAYPAEHIDLQEEIWLEHLLISQFAPGQKTWPSDFPKRNRLMAQLTDASVIVEASDSSGTLHQAAECLRLGRWLFIMKSVVEDSRLEWPGKFVGKPKVVVLTSAADVIERVSRS
ncbi:DNA-processing protein DprA [Devosia sp. Root436]|uniref:DNA-processing protein DprA n=1 Tax=Devosia sp. Root436 TaxID=1736537 RepID=UPI0012E3CC80|nr:DNA-processing protein DprA [Devosia sp. Root436]